MNFQEKENGDTVECNLFISRLTLLKSSVGGLGWILFSVWKLNSYMGGKPQSDNSVNKKSNWYSARNSKNLGITIGTVVSRLLFRKTPISPLLENIYIRIGNKSKADNCQQNIQQNYLIKQNITFLLKGRALKLCITSHPSCFGVSMVLGLNKTKVTLK